MYCPQCGTKVEEGALRCPNGHVLPSAAGAVAGKAQAAVRQVATTLGARTPQPWEVSAVVLGLKVLSMLAVLASLVGWWRAAQFMSLLGMGPGSSLVALGAGLLVSLLAYGVALVVQFLAAEARG